MGTNEGHASRSSVAIALSFSGDEKPELSKVDVTLPSGEKLHTVAGADFLWYRGLRAVCHFLLSFAAWCREENSPAEFPYSGDKPWHVSLTSFFHDDKDNNSTEKMFGSGAGGHSWLFFWIGRKNPEGRDGKPQVFWPKVKDLPPDALAFSINGETLETAEALETLARKLEQQWTDEIEPQPEQHKAEPGLKGKAPSPGTKSPPPPSASHPVSSTSAEPITSPQTKKKTSQAPCSLKGIHSRNSAFNRLIDRIGQEAANITKPILLLGPIGAGKTDLAKRIYDLRRHRGLVTGEFITVDCTMIRGDGAMSALFGHVKGAFTDAKKARVGAVRAANNGLLFLYEIGALGIEEQTMLLQALETNRFRPVGSDEEESSDFQLIAATNGDLKAAVQKGAFREDLWTRIRTWSYELLGLRDRPEDIKPNLDYELKRWEEENGKLLYMSKDVKAKFLNFAMSPEAKWTANLRDLIAIVERMATLAESGFITSDVLETEIDRLKQRWASENEPGGGSDAMLRSLLGADQLAKLDLTERFQLSGVIRVCQESRSVAEAGRKLYAATRHAESNDSDRVVKYLKRFGLRFSDCTNLSSRNA